MEGGVLWGGNPMTPISTIDNVYTLCVCVSMMIVNCLLLYTPENVADTCIKAELITYQSMVMIEQSKLSISLGRHGVTLGHVSLWQRRIKWTWCKGKCKNIKWENIYFKIMIFF